MPEYAHQAKSHTQRMTVHVRRATTEDSDGIARIFLESADHHSGLDSALYWVPALETIKERYRTGGQHLSAKREESVTFVAELESNIVGFVDARLDISTDAMHRDMVFCHIVEIAVDSRVRRCGIGTELLQAAEEWGRAKGAAIALLEFHSANSQASLFYQKRMGYRVTSITVVKSLSG